MIQVQTFRFPQSFFVCLCAAFVIAFLPLTNAQAEPVISSSPVKPQLADATEAKDWSLVAKLIDTGANVNSMQSDGMTPLHWAVYHQNVPLVQQLIDLQCDVNTKTRYEITPLLLACTLDVPNIVQLLLEAGADSNAIQPGGITPLLLAARTGVVEAVDQLLKHGAKVDATERRGQTALMWAASEGNVEVVERLIVANADLNASVKSGFTAMMFAAREGRPRVARALLDAGVDVNFAMKPEKKGARVPRDGTSALLMAVESGHFELAMYLVRRGADPNDQRSGYTPLHVMSWVRKPKWGEDPSGDPPPRGSGKLSSLQFVRAIVEAGADVNAQLERGKGGKAVLNHKGAPPLLLAGKTADVPYMSLLVELGADVTLTNVDGTTPLMAAAGIGVRAVGEEPGSEPEVIEAIDFLVKHGLDVNAVDKNGETAMHGAGYRNFPLVVAHLAKRGATPDSWNHKNEYGWTPVMIAQGKRPGSFKPSPVTVKALQEALLIPSSTTNGLLNGKP